MKKIFILGLCIILSIGILVGCGNNESAADIENEDEVIVMRLAHANPENDPKHMEATRFKELVEEKTNGKVQIDIYGGATLGDWRELIEGLGLETNEIVIEGFGTIDPYTNLSLLDIVPYIYRDYDHFMNVWQGEVGEELLNEASKDASMKLFAPSYRGARITTTSQRFSTIEELKGLNIRVPSDDLSIKTWQRLGAAPTPMALNEVLTGIQQGTVDAQENPIIMSYSFGFYDVVDYLVKTNHRYSADVFMMDQGYFDNLSEDVQDAIIESANEAADYISEYILESELEYEQKWIDAGVEVIEPEREGFEKAVEGLVEEDFPELAEWANKIKAVQ